jgi:hypothetical protein
MHRLHHTFTAARPAPGPDSSQPQKSNDTRLLTLASSRSPPGTEFGVGFFLLLPAKEPETLVAGARHAPVQCPGGPPPPPFLLFLPIPAPRSKAPERGRTCPTPTSCLQDCWVACLPASRPGTLPLAPPRRGTRPCGLAAGPALAFMQRAMAQPGLAQQTAVAAAVV